MNKTHTWDIDLARYLAEYRDEARFMGMCRRCPNYGRLWSCPPFDFDTDARLRKWTKVHIVAMEIDIPEGTPVKDAPLLTRTPRTELEDRLLQMERDCGGLAFGFSGMCLRCESCTRAEGKLCRHPDKVRPALEAYGFDIGKTVTDLFGLQLQWAEGDILPPTLIFVAGLLHNGEIDIHI